MGLEGVSKFFLKIFGSRNERIVKTYLTYAVGALDFEEQIKALDDDALHAKTAEFKAKLADGASPEDIQLEAFAVVRETALRKVQMRHFDVQLVGGNVLYEGKIAEMATGEGKTLVATLAAYLVHLTGRKVHVVTVNDYLAKRDAEWMRPVYESLGLTVGAIQADMDSTGQERKDQYSCDITYGTNNEFGFDYLRDNMKITIEDMAQGPLDYAIIDEVDSILIDEARTPLIISGPAFDDVTRYKKADGVCRQLISLQSGYTRLKSAIDKAERTIANAQGELSDAKKAKDSGRGEKAQAVIDKNETQRAEDELKLERMTQYYEVEYDRKAVHLTHEGIGAAQDIAGLGSFFTGSNMEWPHMLEQSLRAHITFEKEKDYVVIDGKVIIVDEFTGRLMHGRQWSDGLHQAMEGKENVKIKEESQTLATITLQNFFKLYGQIAGMTGTAETEAEEFLAIYGLDVIVMPTNKPCIRDDQDDQIYKSMKEKFIALVEEIYEVSAAGRPVLVGTISIEKSEAISAALTKRYNLEHELLNAKQHEREAHIVEKAGWQRTDRNNKVFGNVTIATNMAGRGTDIKLGEGVAEIGGLHIVGTERHESRRIDNQLRGRAGRQGDAGSSGFFLSFDDDLMQLFGGDKIPKLLSLIGWEEGEPIYHPHISKQIAKTQKKVEERNYEARKSLLEYDEVMDYQRKVFYSRRRGIIEGIRLKETISDMIENVINSICDGILTVGYPHHCVVEWARTNFGVDLQADRIKDATPDEIESKIKQQAKKRTANEISLSLGEYLEDYEDKSTWNIDSLCRWAMSAFGAGLSAGKLKNMTAEEIEQTLVDASADQVDKKDCSQIDDFLKTGFSLKTFIQLIESKFDFRLDYNKLKDSTTAEIREELSESVAEKYKQRQIEYPVEYAMNMVFTPQGANVYGFEALADWANRKYAADLTAESIQNLSPKEMHKKLLELSTSYNNGQLLEEIQAKADSADTEELFNWANERFHAKLDTSQIEDDADPIELVTEAGEAFLHEELTGLEKYVLIQIYDGAWKDHLYAMDHLKESIFLRAFAEKDPKIEYKQEGFRMFNEMLDVIEDRVTGTIFKVHLEAGTSARSVWNVSQTSHDEVNHFAMAQRQQAAATAPQGEIKVKQIKLEQPKVGRNEPCPCGSGKKYKKCCGKNA
ncbi:MAG TPA: preprotein translocase subunit SecA [Phycisphaerales bacterium]|nr:preprotein translocase subunit SecA [Phycisphaerales bacterium]